MSQKPPFLGKILVEKRFITQLDLEDALRVQDANKEFLGEILLQKGLITEAQLYECLAEQCNMELVHIKDKEIDWEIVDIFSKSLILEHKCIPLEERDGTIILAVSDPLDAWVVSEAEQQAKGHPVRRVLAYKSEIQEVLEKYRQHMKNKMKELFGF